MVAGRLFQVGYVDWRPECSSLIKETNVGLWLRCHTNCASKPAECTSYKTANNKLNETWAETWRRVWGGRPSRSICMLPAKTCISSQYQPLLAIVFDKFCQEQSFLIEDLDHLHRLANSAFYTRFIQAFSQRYVSLIAFNGSQLFLYSYSPIVSHFHTFSVGNRQRNQFESPTAQRSPTQRHTCMCNKTWRLDLLELVLLTSSL